MMIGHVGSSYPPHPPLPMMSGSPLLGLTSNIVYSGWDTCSVIRVTFWGPSKGGVTTLGSKKKKGKNNASFAPREEMLILFAKLQATRTMVGIRSVSTQNELSLSLVL